MLQRIALIALLLSSALHAQAPASQVPTDQQELALYDRCVQLIEASGVASPELGRAAAPLAENMRQTVESLRFLGPRNPQLHYRFMTNLRAFLLVSDAVPKPVPFPEIGKVQLQELRDAFARIELYFQNQIEQLQRELRNPDRDDLARYHDADATLGPPKAGNPRIVFLGDSITDWWRLNEYFPGKDYVNRGISGQITGQMLGRFLADVAQLKPSAVFILAGTNDIARGVSPTAIQDNIKMICDLADTYKIKVIIASILPVSDHHKGTNPAFERTRQRPINAILEMNKWLQTFCASRGYTYANYYPAMSDPSGQLAPNLSDDGLHPNPTGYRIMAPIAIEAIEKTLNPAGAAQAAPKKRRLF
jgi:lysophospholipase L1-like esterase